MYNLALIERFNDKYHGKTKCSSNDIENSNMVVYIITPEEFYNDEYIIYKQLADKNKKIINNDVNKIFENTSLEIVEVLELSGLEHVGIIKTFWLKIFQRKIRSFLISIC
tara:strand:+ start:4860 stop:5189 length:330 start_codon:yes stop_codon:yes gene_type:complete